jgi:membrane protease YdiL (CAAX protease family)
MQSALVSPSHRPESDDAFAARLRGFGPVGIVAFLIILAGLIPAIMGVLVLVWAWRSHTPWRDIGYVRPRSWVRTVAIAIVLGAFLKLLMKAVVMPMFGADPINQRYHYLAGNSAALLPMIFAIVIGAGFGEETFFRGYLFERLGKLIGSSAIAKAFAVLITSAWFALVHYPDQRLAGVQQAAITGLTFGTVFALTGSLFPLMLAHAAFDLTALAIIYWDLETAVAHSIFR